MTAILLVVVLGWCAAIAWVLPSEKDVWRLRQLVDRHERMTP